ncbi:MAG: hypothetical protein IJY04_05945 [Clostridia bacterium]|nr:hypothetical protein [Clostridia bacterium]
MNEKEKFDNASSRITEETIAIEAAETDIKEQAKKSVKNAEPRSEYMKKVGEILKKHLARVRSPTLRETALNSLADFSAKVYNEEKRLLELYYGVYKIAVIAKEQNARDGEKMYLEALELIGDLRKAPGLNLLIAIDAPPPPLDFDIRGTGHDPLLTSEAMVDDGTPSGVYRRALPLNELHETYMKRVKAERDLLALESADALYTHNVSLRNIAEMTVRYEAQTKMIEDLRGSGVRLVYIEPHANCSKRCAKYQVGGSKHPSGLYSLDETEGITEEDGVPYRPLSFATDNPEDSYTTAEGKTYQNGCVTGYNCRHRLIPYKPYNKPPPIPARVIKERREWEETQREMERNIRLLRGKVLQSTSSEERAKYKAKVNALVAKYESFSRERGIAFYPARTKIF